MRCLTLIKYWVLVKLSVDVISFDLLYTVPKRADSTIHRIHLLPKFHQVRAMEFTIDSIHLSPNKMLWGQRSGFHYPQCPPLFKQNAIRSKQWISLSTVSTFILTKCHQVQAVDFTIHCVNLYLNKMPTGQRYCHCICWVLSVLVGFIQCKKHRIMTRVDNWRW